MDGAILVVAGTDGTMPQTKEHLLLANLVGVKNIVVFINKVDMIEDQEMVELVELEMREALAEFGYDGDNTPIVTGSALCAMEDRNPEIGVEAIKKLLDSVDEWIPDPMRELDKPFLMPIEGIFSIPGRGTVVTGRVERGEMKKGDAAEFVGLKSNVKTTITGLETFKQQLEVGQAGDQLGVLVRGVKREDVRRGMILCPPGSVVSHTQLKGQVYILKKEEGGRHTPFVNNYSPQLYTRTASVNTSMMLPEGVEMVMPGDDTELTLVLKHDIPLETGQRFTLRDGGKTIGHGVVTQILQ
jgi:elongation factor Tu